MPLLKEEKIARYIDFKLSLTVEPDLNDCAWLKIEAPYRFNRANPSGWEDWDLKVFEVEKLRDACNKFLENYYSAKRLSEE